MLALVPTLVPFTFHWYDGDEPPLVMLAVKVTLVPVHTLLADALTLTVGVTCGVTVMVTELDVAVAGDTQVALLVITQVTILPLAKLLAV